jgi:hypothetical protein
VYTPITDTKQSKADEEKFVEQVALNQRSIVELHQANYQLPLNSNIEVSGSVESEECLEKSMVGDLAQIDSKIGPQVGVEGQVMKAEHFGLHGGQDMEVEEDIIDTEQSKADEEKFVERAALNHGSIVDVHQANYHSKAEHVGLHGGQDMEVEEDIIDTEQAKADEEKFVDTEQSKADEENFVEQAALNQRSIGELHQANYQLPLNSKIEVSGLVESEECLEKSMAGDLAQIDSKIGPQVGVEGQVMKAEHVGLHGGQDLEVEEDITDIEQSKADEEKFVERATLNHGNVVDVHQAIYHSKAKHVGLHGGQDMEVEEDIIDTEQSKADEEKFVDIEQSKADEEKFVEQAALNQRSIVELHQANYQLPLNSNIEVSGLVESEECLEKSQAGDLTQIDSKIEPHVGVEGQVMKAEHVGLHGGQDMEVEEDITDTEQSKADEEKFVDIEQSKADEEKFVEHASLNQRSIVELHQTNYQLPLNSNIEVSGSVESEECLEKSMASDLAQIDSKIGPQVGVEGQVMKAEYVGLHGGQDLEVEEDITDTEQSKADEEKFVERAALNHGSVVDVHQASYQLPPENEDEFSVSDLVWGKVRSHPWWPGQIFDPSDSSEKAMKHYKKDYFLVAYFGDRTFAWNEASQLKPFRTHFSHEEKQSNSETFQNAVDCALEEVSRRVEFGLACSCMPNDAYEDIKFQIVENAGIHQESSIREGVDGSASASSFEPDNLIEYVKALAQFPSGGGDRLELVIAKAQLLAFYRLKGYCSLPEFQGCGQLLESDTDTLVYEDREHSSEMYEHATTLYKDDELTSFKQEILKSQNNSSHKRKHNLKDDVYYKKKERRLSELMGGMIDSPDGDNLSDGKTTGVPVSLSAGKKRKSVDYHDDHVPQDGRKTISFAKVSSTTPPSFPKPSFKIGDCIRRVASQLTGSPAILKSNSERFQKLDGNNDIAAGDEADVSFQDSEDAQRGRMIVSTEYSSLEDLLSQLQIAAQDPMRGYGFLNVVVSFFSDFRNSEASRQYSERDFLAMDKVGGKRKKTPHPVAGSPETFEFEDMSDTYWTDRVIQNGSEEQPSRRSRKRDYQIVPVQLENSLQGSRRPYSRKRYSDGNHAVATEKPVGYVDENSPAEIVMNFSEVNSVPSETNLNKTFRRFGPLKESETEVDRDTSRARVVFKKSSDAEVAFSSAGRFNIFGPMLVNYQLSYTPSALFKASPMDTALDHEMQLDLAVLEVNLV